MALSLFARRAAAAAIVGAAGAAAWAPGQGTVRTVAPPAVAASPVTQIPAPHGMPAVDGVAAEANGPSAAAAAPDGPVVFDAAVIGAGLAGLAAARYLAVRGARVVVLEAQDVVAAGASSGNSGLGCTGCGRGPGPVRELVHLTGYDLI